MTCAIKEKCRIPSENSCIWEHYTDIRNNSAQGILLLQLPGVMQVSFQQRAFYTQHPQILLTKTSLNVWELLRLQWNRKKHKIWPQETWSLVVLLVLTMCNYAHRDVNTESWADYIVIQTQQSTEHPYDQRQRNACRAALNIWSQTCTPRTCGARLKQTAVPRASGNVCN